MMTSELTSTSSLSFDQLADLLVRQSALSSPAELHGNLCGHLAAGGRYNIDTWLSTAAELLELSVLEDAELISALTRLYDQSLNQLGGGDFSFELLMPEDDMPIDQRVEALGLWCHGFLSSYGMAGGQLRSGDGLSADCAESLQDLVQISQVAVMDEDDDEIETSEADFAEVFEYVRMSALLVFSEINGGERLSDDDDMGDGPDDGSDQRSEVLH